MEVQAIILYISLSLNPSGIYYILLYTLSPLTYEMNTKKTILLRRYNWDYPRKTTSGNVLYLGQDILISFPGFGLHWVSYLNVNWKDGWFVHLMAMIPFVCPQKNWVSEFKTWFWKGVWPHSNSSCYVSYHVNNCAVLFCLKAHIVLCAWMLLRDFQLEFIQLSVS